MILTIVGSFLSILISIYIYLTWNFNYWKRRGVAGPKPQPYVGTYPSSALLKEGTNFLTETDEIYRKYYRKHRFIGLFECTTPTLLILDPLLVKDIHVKYFKNFQYNLFADTIVEHLDPLFHRNPFIDKGEQWKDRRAEISPAFTILKIKPMYPIINDVCRQMVEFIAENIKSGKSSFGPKEITDRFTAEVVCNCIYGLDANAFGERSEFLEISSQVFISPTLTTYIHTQILAIFPFLRKFAPTQVVATNANEWFINLLKHAIQLRQQSKIERDDFLSFLLDLQEKNDTPLIELAGHAFTFFLDGFETSSYFLSSAIIQLAKNPQCQNKLRAEIQNVDTNNFDVLHRLQYLDDILNETLRISPFPFPIWKRCTEDIELDDFDGTTVKIEKGTGILLPNYSLHHHVDYYPDSNVFRPERFAENSGGIKHFKDLGVFLPFGNGPRLCLGMKFATTQIKAAICELITNFELISLPVKPSVSGRSGLLFFAENNSVIEFKRIE